MGLKNFIICLGLVFSFTATLVAGEEYQIDRAHSRVGFAVTHMLLTTVRGHFNEYSGTINYDKDNIANSSVNVTITSSSIDTDNERRDNHLRSDDFLNAEKFPKITFVSKNVLEKDDGHVLVGDLTIRDVTKEVEMPFEITGSLETDRGTRMGFSARLTINRMDYNVKWDRTLDTGGLVVSDEVTIEIEGQAIHRVEESNPN